MKNRLFFLIIIILFSVNSYAWESNWDLWGSSTSPSNHTTLTNKAYEKIASDYNDLDSFKNDIITGANNETAHPFPYTSNFGDPNAWWTTAQADYCKLNFKKAYNDIGKICHLTQDMAVPAHAADISHTTSILLEIFPGLHVDDFENYASSNESLFGSGAMNDGDKKQPDEFYGLLLENTADHCPILGTGFITTWFHPDLLVPYWLRCCKGSSGCYGGLLKGITNDQGDIYKYKGEVKSPWIITDRAQAAITNTTCVLIRASKL